MKKIISALLALAMLLSLTACQPTVATDNFDFLADYTIVYPDEYTSFELEEAKLLQSVIKELTGKEIPMVKDTEAEKEHEIIIASSSRKTGASATVDAFTSGLDYIVAVDGDDIVLGGNHYYGDLKAIYDFINNYLGYNDLTKTFADAVSKIEGTKTVLYKEPAINITAPIDGATPFASQNDVAIMAEAGFNMTRLDTTIFTVEELRHYAKWCARYNIRILQRGAYIDKEARFLEPDAEYMKDCPIIYGHWVMENYRTGDLPIYERLCAAYKEQFEGYGWKLVFAMQSAMGTAKLNPNILDKQSTDILLDGADTFSVLQDIKTADSNISRDEDRLNAANIIKLLANETGRDMWIRITAIYTSIEDLGEVPFEPQEYNYERANWLRWAAYCALAYGVTGVEYQYYKHGHVINDDFTKSELYDTVKAVNTEILAVAEILSGYEWQGVYIQNQDLSDNFTKLDTPIADPESYIDLAQPNGYQKSCLIGCFKAKDGSGNVANIIFTTDPLPEKPEVFPSSKANFNGKVIYTYKDGEIKALEEKTGGYNLSMKDLSEIIFTKDN